MRLSRSVLAWSSSRSGTGLSTSRRTKRRKRASSLEKMTELIVSVRWDGEYVMCEFQGKKIDRGGAMKCGVPDLG